MSDDTVERVTPGTDSWKSYGEEHLQRYSFFSSLYRGKTVLDAACGTGYGTAYSIEQGAAKATGLDISEEAIAFAKKNYQHQQLTYLNFDVSDLQKLGTKADLVISFETIEHLGDPERFIRNAAAALNEGGMMICSTPNKKRLSGAGNNNPFHLNELDWHDFRRIFEKYFVVNNCYHQTESVSYMRYMELRHLLHQQKAQMNAFLSSRLELRLRRLTGKTFQPIPFMNERLADLKPGDITIEPLDQPEDWHKTFIITGVVRRK